MQPEDDEGCRRIVCCQRWQQRPLQHLHTRYNPLVTSLLGRLTTVQDLDKLSISPRDRFPYRRLHYRSRCEPPTLTATGPPVACRPPGEAGSPARTSPTTPCATSAGEYDGQPHHSWSWTCEACRLDYMIEAFEDGAVSLGYHFITRMLRTHEPPKKQKKREKKECLFSHTHRKIESLSRS